MPDVLIVEDVTDTTNVLKMLIEQSFPGWEIERATSVAEARALIEVKKTPYRFAILDFKLPDSPKGDLSLCATIRARMPATRIVHITAFAQDPEIQRHVREVHLEQFNSDHAIEKGMDWMKLLVERLERFDHTDRIACKLADLFPANGGFVTARDTLSRTNPVGGSITSRLFDLCADARIHWRYLSEPLKQEIKATLTVDDSKRDDVHISLFGEQSVEPTLQIPDKTP